MPWSERELKLLRTLYQAQFARDPFFDYLDCCCHNATYLPMLPPGVPRCYQQLFASFAFLGGHGNKCDCCSDKPLLVVERAWNLFDLSDPKLRASFLSRQYYVAHLINADPRQPLFLPNRTLEHVILDNLLHLHQFNIYDHPQRLIAMRNLSQFIQFFIDKWFPGQYKREIAYVQNWQLFCSTSRRKSQRYLEVFNNGVLYLDRQYSSLNRSLLFGLNRRVLATTLFQLLGLSMTADIQEFANRFTQFIGRHSKTIDLYSDDLAFVRHPVVFTAQSIAGAPITRSMQILRVHNCVLRRIRRSDAHAPSISKPAILADLVAYYLHYKWNVKQLFRYCLKAARIDPQNQWNHFDCSYQDIILALLRTRHLEEWAFKYEKEFMRCPHYTPSRSVDNIRNLLRQKKRKDIQDLDRSQWQSIISQFNRYYDYDAHFILMKNIAARKQCRLHKCRQKNVKLRKCNRCNSVYYCQKKHQKLDWARHKYECVPCKKAIVRMRTAYPTILLE